MNIADMLEKRDAAFKDFAQAFKRAKPGAADIARPLAVRMARAEALSNRIEMVEAQRQQANARADAEVAALTAEIKMLKQDMARQEEMLAPALGKKPADKKPSVTKASGAKATRPAARTKRR